METASGWGATLRTAAAWIGGASLLAGAALAARPALQAPAFDLVIRNGKIVDGTGNPAFAADVGVKAGRIARIGRIAEKGAQEVDAKGLIVAPGFIDVHTHAENVLEFPQAGNFVRMGVTSIVVGNCGNSEKDIGEFFSKLETKGASLNVASLVGHNTVRSAAMGGNFDREPTPEEAKKMRGMVEKAMRDGAVGLSSGLIYLPGTFSKTPEIAELAKAIAPYDGIYTSHMRNEGLKILEAIDELCAVAKEAGVRAELSHIKLSGESMWGKADQVLARIERARAEGIEITQDQYVYTASSTSISTLIGDFALEGGPEAFAKRVADPDTKEAIVKDMKERLARRGRTDYGYAVIARYAKDASLNGKNVVEAARAMRGSDTLDNQIETILTIQLSGGASAIFHGMDENDLQSFLRHPNTMIASDSAIRDAKEGIPHPRGYGNNARVLARYVRELGVLRLEDAVRKMTSLPAQTFRLPDRGLLKEGFWADIVAFDPATVQDRALYSDPHHSPDGIPWVFVNGVAVVDRGEHTAALPGKALRRR